MNKFLLFSFVVVAVLISEQSHALDYKIPGFYGPGPGTSPLYLSASTQGTGRNFKVTFVADVPLEVIGLSSDELSELLGYLAGSVDIGEKRFSALIKKRKLRVEILRQGNVIATCSSTGRLSNVSFGVSPEGAITGAHIALYYSSPTEKSCRTGDWSKLVNIQEGDRLQVRVAKSRRLIGGAFKVCSSECANS